MVENQQNENVSLTHGKYTDAYIEILNTYKKYLLASTDEKLKLKNNFFDLIKKIMLITVSVFAGVIIFSLIILGMMVYRKNNSIQIIAGSITAIISSFVTVILTIFKLPQIIAEYLFNKNEDEQMGKIIENIQKYELNAARFERNRGKAKIDAVSKTKNSDIDTEINQSKYIDSVKTNLSNSEAI